MLLVVAYQRMYAPISGTFPMFANRMAPVYMTTTTFRPMPPPSGGRNTGSTAGSMAGHARRYGADGNDGTSSEEENNGPNDDNLDDSEANDAAIFEKKKEQEKQAKVQQQQQQEEVKRAVEPEMKVEQLAGKREGSEKGNHLYNNINSVARRREEGCE